MIEEYYCTNEKKFVLTVVDIFKHPHLGMKSCYICRDCRGMVMLKEKVEKDARR